MTVSYWQDSRREKQVIDADVVIVGAGLIGAACAYWLSQRQAVKVVVLEARSPGSGASGRDAGFAVRTLFAYYNEAIRIYGREVARYLLTFNENSLQYLADLSSSHDKFSWHRCGSYLLACSDAELQDLEASSEFMREDGFQVVFCRTDPLSRGYKGALFNPSDASVNTSQLVDLMLQISNAQVFGNEEVWKIEPIRGGTSGAVRVHSAGFIVNCDRLLFTTNAYAPLFQHWFADKIQAVRGQILVTAPLPKMILQSMCSANYGWDYFRQLPDMRFLLGGRRFMQRTEETGYADTVTAPLQFALQDYLTEFFPEVCSSAIDYRWSGVMAFTPDELPIIGELINESLDGTAETVPGAFYAIGCNGHGLGPGLGLAKRLVDLAMDGSTPGVFGYDRLSESGDQVKWCHASQPGAG